MATKRRASSPTKSPQAVPEYLVLGSFPLPNHTPGHWLETAYACEHAFAPREGDSFDGREWTRIEAHDGHLNFLSPEIPFEERAWCCCYALTYVKSATAKNVQLLLASDDGVQVYLNGEEVHKIDVQRGHQLDQDQVNIRLKKGWNALLFKVAQGEAGWSLQARLASMANGDPRVTFSLQAPKTAFPGLKGRQEGLQRGTVSPQVLANVEDGQLSLSIGIWLFNDNDIKSGPVQLSITGDAGDSVISKRVKSMDPFEGGWRTLVLETNTIAQLLGEGDHELVAESTVGTLREPLPHDLLVQVFLQLAFGLPVNLEDDAFMVPESLQGTPALLEIYETNPNALTREVAWPKLPAREVSAKETATGQIALDLEYPKGMPAIGARIVFGNKKVRDLVSRIRFLRTELGASLESSTVHGADGLRAFVDGKFGKVKSVLSAIYDNMAAEQPDRSNEKLTLVGHAHIDMNWLWVNWETVQCCHDSFRQVLHFMKEFPEFTFSQSMASTYRMVEETDAEMFKQIKKYVKEGRWEIIGGEVDEGDTNLSSGEAICRSFLLGQRYFRKHFNKQAKVGWLPDNFGHVAQLPQILNLCGIRFFYAHRCQPYRGPYNWESPDGSRVLVFATTTYNGDITPEIREYPAAYNKQHQHAIWVYGVGDHGGGPSRRDITRALAYRDMPGFPQMEFSTATDFYEEIEEKREDYPEAKGELQYTFEGCYTSISRIKEMNRKGENLLYSAELLASMAMLDGEKYDQHRFNEAWWKQAFNQFHDILCGSATHDSNQESIARYDQVLSDAHDLLYEATRRIAATINTQKAPEGAQPVVVFNPIGRKATDYVTAEIFSYTPPPSALLRHWGEFIPRPAQGVDCGQGPYPSIRLEDSKGNSIRAQILTGKLFPNGYRLWVSFLTEDMPPCGWKTYYAFPNEPGHGEDAALKLDDTTIETDTLKVVVNPKTGLVDRIYDKELKREVLDRNGNANMLRIYHELPHGMTAWCIGPIKSQEELLNAESVKVTEIGPVRAVVESVRHWNRSTFTQRVIVYRDRKQVEFELDADWFEVGNPREGFPMLRVALPLNARKGAFNCDTPYAVCERTTDGQEVPAQKWVDVSNDKGGAALLSDSKYGFRCEGSVLEMTILRASYDPDLYPDQGPHRFRYCLVPHEGDWKKARIDVAGLLYNTTLLTAQTPVSKGKRDTIGSFVKLAPKNVHLSAIKKAEDSKGIVVRFYEAHGRKAKAKLTLHKSVKSAKRVDVLEDDLKGANKPEISGKTITVAVDPHEIVSLLVKF